MTTGLVAQFGGAGPDGPAQQSVAGQLAGQAQQPLAECQGAGMGDAVAHVVAESAEVGDVVGDTFDFQEQGSQAGRVLGYLDPQGVFDGLAVSQVVADRAVAGYTFGEGDSVADGSPFEELFDAAVDEPQAGFHLEDGLAHDGETEVAGFDEPGVDGADGDFVHAWSFDGDEGERSGVTAHGGRRAGVVSHWVPPRRPVLVEDQRTREGMAEGCDPEQVVHFSFEAAGGERQAGKGGHGRSAAFEADLQLDAPVWCPGEEHVHRSQGWAVVVAGDEGEPESALEQGGRFVL
jgi:hypothetical protein